MMTGKPIPRITEHAVDKYCSITGCDDRRKAKRKLREWFRRSKHSRIPKNYLVERVINNRFTEARYYEFNQYRFVVVEGEMVTFEEKY